MTFSIVFVVLQFCIGFVVFQFLKSKKSLTEKYGKVSVVLHRFCISFAVGFCGFAVQKKDTDRNILKPVKFLDSVRFCSGFAVGGFAVLRFCSPEKDTDKNILKPAKFQDSVRFCSGFAVGGFCGFAVCSPKKKTQTEIS